MNNNKEEVLILGAGPSGLACALELSKNSQRFSILEKDNQVGGLSKTLVFGDFKTDIGPHRFFSQKPFLYKLIGGLLGESWITVDRLTRFFIQGKFYLYPIDFKDALSKAGFFKASHFAIDYFWETLKKNFRQEPARNLEEKLVRDFGKALVDFNMRPFNYKLWGLPINQISVDWAEQRILGLSVMAIIKKMFFKQKAGPKTLVDCFYYPDNGNSLIYEAMKKEALANGLGSLELNSFPTKIFHNEKEITSVDLQADQSCKNYSINHLVSSIPLTELVYLLDPLPPQEVLLAVEHLRFRSHISLFISLNKEKVFPDQWIYLPDKETPFCRMMEPRNFSKKMSPNGKTSLLLEFFCWENDKIWNADKKEIFELGITWLEKLGFAKKEEVIDFFIHKEKYAYPVYDLEYKKYLKEIKEYLKQFKNLQIIGRAGCFRYNNQDHALEMGLGAAKNIISKKPYKVEEAGEKQEYFEKGYLDEKKETKLLKNENAKLFVRYVIFTGMAAVIELALLYALTEFLGIWYFYSAIIAYIVGMILNFSLNKKLNFKNKSSLVAQQFGIFTGVSLVGLALNQSILYILVEFAGLGYMLARCIALVVVMLGWSFYGHKKLTFNILK